MYYAYDKNMCFISKPGHDFANDVNFNIKRWSLNHEYLKKASIYFNEIIPNNSNIFTAIEGIFPFFIEERFFNLHLLPVKKLSEYQYCITGNLDLAFEGRYVEMEGYKPVEIFPFPKKINSISCNTPPWYLIKIKKIR